MSKFPINSASWLSIEKREFYFQAYVHQGTKFSGRPQAEVLNQYTEEMGLASVDYGDFWKT